MTEHRPDSTPATPTRQAGGSFRLIVVVLVVLLGVALLALLMFGRG